MVSALQVLFYFPPTDLIDYNTNSNFDDEQSLQTQCFPSKTSCVKLKQCFTNVSHFCDTYMVFTMSE